MNSDGVSRGKVAVPMAFLAVVFSLSCVAALASAVALVTVGWDTALVTLAAAVAGAVAAVGGLQNLTRRFAGDDA